MARGGKRKGAGRPREERAKKLVAFKLDPEVVEWIETKAKEQKTSKSKLVNDILIDQIHS